MNVKIKKDEEHLKPSDIMTVSDFRIGLEFSCGDKRWRCTDVGIRTIVAIELKPGKEDWLNGPPYAVPEIVFDEEDLKVCEVFTGQ